MNSMHPVRRTAIYSDGIRVLPACCCGRLIPEQQFIVDWGVCPAHLGYPEPSIEARISDDDMPF